MIAAALRPTTLQVHARPACLFSVPEEQLQPLLVKPRQAKKAKKSRKSRKRKMEKQQPRQLAL
jgi:hypothetical protein